MKVRIWIGRCVLVSNESAGGGGIAKTLPFPRFARGHLRLGMLRLGAGTQCRDPLFRAGRAGEMKRWRSTPISGA